MRINRRLWKLNQDMIHCVPALSYFNYVSFTKWNVLYQVHLECDPLIKCHVENVSKLYQLRQINFD